MRADLYVCNCLIWNGCFLIPLNRVSQIGVPKRGQSTKEKFDGDKQPFFPIFHKKVAFRVVGSRGMVQRR